MLAAASKRTARPGTTPRGVPRPRTSPRFPQSPSAHTKTAKSTNSRPEPRGGPNVRPSACAETAPTTASLARLGARPVPSRTGSPEGNATHKDELRPKKRMSGNRNLFPSVSRRNQRKSSGVRRHVYALALYSYNQQRSATTVEGRGASPQTDTLRTTDASRKVEGLW